MATHIKIFSVKEQIAFENPPEYGCEDRKKYFYIGKWERNIISTYKTDIAKIGFILQFGYFKSNKRFYLPDKFKEVDIIFVSNKLNISPQPTKIDFNDFKETTFRRQRKIILEKTGIQKFSSKQDIILKEAINLCSKQLKPKFIFLSLLDYLEIKKIEIPSYYFLSQVITDTLKSYENNLVSMINQYLSPDNKKILDMLLLMNNTLEEKESGNDNIKRYKITLLKKSNYSTRPMKIKENIEDLKTLKSLFTILKPVVKEMKLSLEVIRYYSQILIKSQVFQISRREDNKYLLLICFIVHQYYTLNDLLVEILIHTTQSNANICLKTQKENFYQSRINKKESICNISGELNKQLDILQEIKNIINTEKSNFDKVKAIEYFFVGNKDETHFSLLKNQLAKIEGESDQIIKNTDYYIILEQKSRKIQNRVSEIIKNIDFDEISSNTYLIEAILYFKKKNGVLSLDVPKNFIDESLQEILIDQNKKLRVSLYKVLLFEKIATSIKSGAVTLDYSYKYRAFNDYLISKNSWDINKSELLIRAGINNYFLFDKVKSDLKLTLHKQYKKTNETIINGNNNFAKKSKNNKISVTTPKKEKELPDRIISLFPKNRFISLYEVLSTVNKFTGFIDAFSYWNIKNNREKPRQKIFFAGTIGYGCNIGIRKIAKISNNININELENTINWYYTVDNLNNANNKIIELTEKMQLKNLFKDNQDITHTSSDGQKFGISVDSLNSNHSFKYFGKGKGVSVYSFIDDSNRLFHSTVISPAEREAAYVIDGLMHNDVVESDIHSTDTHGYSEIVFGISYLLGISFAPRIKGFKNQRLYSFEKSSVYKNLDYQVIPDRVINVELISKNWDDILRLVATIKMRETTASQLFKRLSSYSRQHPLYSAIKEFGKIIKSIFLLKYIDDVELRQSIEKQLNKLESSNKLAKAVFYGNNQEFQQSTKEEQLIAEGCKRLIENAIICWNYLYLSQQIFNTKTKEEKDLLIKTIKNSSVVSWEHINFQGEYNFSDDVLENAIDFDLKKLLEESVF